MADRDASVVVDALSREFGAITALEGVDLTIDAPTILGLAGPNGSGKTTLLRCLLGLLAPSTGSVQVFGQAATDLDADARRAIGYMPQADAVYTDLTVRENVAFFARLYGVPDRSAAVEGALDVVGLGHRAGDRVATLSGGMVRRTSLACAVVHDPTVLVLDEPTVGLDPALREEMWERFRTWRSEGAIIVLSTHYLGEVGHCDRIVFLRDGQVLADDTPAAVRTATGTDDLEAAFLALLADEGERRR
ncbi:MAG: ABC transporter ATP-binding protein [Halobacteriaceae archaeon]